MCCMKPGARNVPVGRALIKPPVVGMRKEEFEQILDFTGHTLIDQFETSFKHKFGTES